MKKVHISLTSEFHSSCKKVLRIPYSSFFRTRAWVLTRPTTYVMYYHISSVAPERTLPGHGFSIGKNLKFRRKKIGHFSTSW